MPLRTMGNPTAYPLYSHLQKPFQGPRLNDEQKEFNTSMSSVRMSVEWLFCDLINYFKFCMGTQLQTIHTEPPNLNKYFL